MAMNDSSNPVEDQPQAHRTGSSYWRVIAIVGVIALALSAGAIALVLGGNDSSESTDEIVAQGVSVHLAGDPDSAEVLYLRALESEPDNALALYNLGVIRQSQQQPAEAALFFRKAIDSDPEMQSAHVNLAWAMRDLGDISEAVGILEALRLQRPDDPLVLFHLGQMLIAAGNVDEGSQLINDAIEIDPSLLTID